MGSSRCKHKPPSKQDSRCTEPFHPSVLVSQEQQKKPRHQAHMVPAYSQDMGNAQASKLITLQPSYEGAIATKHAED